MMHKVSSRVENKSWGRAICTCGWTAGRPIPNIHTKESLRAVEQQMRAHKQTMAWAKRQGLRP